MSAEHVRALHQPAPWPYKPSFAGGYPYGEGPPPTPDAQVCEHCTHTHGDPHYDNIELYPCPTLLALVNPIAEPLPRGPR